MSEDVLNLENQRWAALIDGDYETLDRLVHPDLTYTHSNAMVDTKTSWIESMTSGFVDYQAVEREDVAIVTSGTTAVITGKADFTVGIQGGTTLTIVARFTSVWVNENGTWQFFAWQNTPIPS